MPSARPHYGMSVQEHAVRLGRFGDRRRLQDPAAAAGGSGECGGWGVGVGGAGEEGLVCRRLCRRGYSLELRQMVSTSKYRGATRYRYRTFKVPKYRLTTGWYIFNVIFLDTGANSFIKFSIRRHNFFFFLNNATTCYVCRSCTAGELRRRGGGQRGEGAGVRHAVCQPAGDRHPRRHLLEGAELPGPAEDAPLLGEGQWSAETGVSSVIVLRVVLPSCVRALRAAWKAQ